MYRCRWRSVRHERREEKPQDASPGQDVAGSLVLSLECLRPASLLCGFSHPLLSDCLREFVDEHGWVSLPSSGLIIARSERRFYELLHTTALSCKNKGKA